MAYWILLGKTPIPHFCPIEWLIWMASTDRHVALTLLEGDTTLLEGDIEVSTVFLGSDHLVATGTQRLPMLFETMVFSSGSLVDSLQRRYSTWEQAEIGHQEIVDRLTAIGTYSTNEMN